MDGKAKEPHAERSGDCGRLLAAGTVRQRGTKRPMKKIMAE
jgi:hypothetical protein